MPANPVKVQCDIISRYDVSNDIQLVTAIYEAVSVFYNTSNSNNGTCYNLNNTGPSTLQDEGGWNYQSWYHSPTSSILHHILSLLFASHFQSNDFFFISMSLLLCHDGILIHSTEMVMPMGQYGGDSDMFYPQPWNLLETVTTCGVTYNPVQPRPMWVNTFYGAKNLATATNIVFTNGDLDPWYAIIHFTCVIHANVVTTVLLLMLSVTVWNLLCAVIWCI